MDIQIPFDLGQKVYIPFEEYRKKTQPCTICDQKGVVTLKGHTFDCPRCQGRLTVETTHCRRVPKAGRVEAFELEQTQDGVRRQYRVRVACVGIFKRLQAHVLRDKHVCQLVCNQLNEEAGAE